jgi:hypothetical protein
MYPYFGLPGPLTIHIDAPQLGLGSEKAYLTPTESDWKMSRTNWKYRGDRFRPKILNELVPTKPIVFPPQELPQFTRQQQAFPTSYSVPCTYTNSSIVSAGTDPTVNPQCATCLRLQHDRNQNNSQRCITENNMWPNGSIADVAINTSPQCKTLALMQLNECGVQCGQPRDYGTTSASCWPESVIAELSR